MSLNCKKVARVFSITVCTGARKESPSIRHGVPNISRRSWQRKFVTSPFLRAQSTEMEDVILKQQADLLKELEHYKWLGSKSPCFPVLGNKVIFVF